MKTKHLLIIVGLFVLANMPAKSQTNVLLPTGNAGIGTTTPTCLFQVTGGSVLFDGAAGGTPTAGAGSRMMWIPSKWAFRAGYVVASNWDDASIGIGSFAGGRDCKASGSYSTAFGATAVASGSYSFAVGNSSTSSGSGSIALGINSTASGPYSNVIGYYCASSGYFATAIGFHTTAQAYGCFVIGKYNKLGSFNASTWVDSDPLFVIGNGQNSVSTNNALTVLKNGNIGVNTDLMDNTYNGTSQYFKFAVNGSMRAKEIVVNTTWSDFVFDNGYQLKSLKEVESYIQKNQHLPGIPSANEIEFNGGNVGELLKLQMQKIEELTLYIIEQEKRIEALENR